MPNVVLINCYHTRDASTHIILHVFDNLYCRRRTSFNLEGNCRLICDIMSGVLSHETLPTLLRMPSLFVRTKFCKHVPIHMTFHGVYKT